MNATQCRFCGTVGIGPHLACCPTVDGNPTQAQVEWNRGFGRGFNDEVIPNYMLPHYSIWFRRGYQRGKEEIDRLVDDAAQARCFG